MNIIFKILKLLGNMIIIPLYSIFTAFCTIIIASAFFVFTNIFFQENGFNFKIILFLILALSIIIGLWALIFLKHPIFKKLQILIVFIVYSLILYNAPSIVVYFNSNIQSDYCIEDGDCKEGRIVYTKYGQVEINELNCLKYNWDWDKRRRQCKIPTIDFVGID